MAKTIQIRIEDDMKTAVELLFSDLGLDISTAVRMFFSASLRNDGLPFPVTRDIPNRETVRAIEEVQRMKKNPNKYKTYENFSEIVSVLHEDSSDDYEV
jgi:DNA-damage-inducible protein J